VAFIAWVGAFLSVFRHGRACPGHPRGTVPPMPKFSIHRCFSILFGELGVLVDGRVKPGHDEKTEGNALPTANALRANARSPYCVRCRSEPGLTRRPGTSPPRQAFPFVHVQGDEHERARETGLLGSHGFCVAGADLVEHIGPHRLQRQGSLLARPGRLCLSARPPAVRSSRRLALEGMGPLRLERARGPRLSAWRRVADALIRKEFVGAPPPTKGRSRFYRAATRATPSTLAGQALFPVAVSRSAFVHPARGACDPWNVLAPRRFRNRRSGVDWPIRRIVSGKSQARRTPPPGARRPC